MARFMERSWETVPWFARIIMIVQAIVIAGLVAWTYNEYVNNSYLQIYLDNLVQGKGSMIAALGIGGLLGTAIVGIFLKAGNTLREIDALSERATTRTEEMRASSLQVEPMPVLKVVNQDPQDPLAAMRRSRRKLKDSSGNWEES